MERFIPKEKLSKKAKRELNAKGRGVWGIDPVSRRTRNKRIYDRKTLRIPDDGNGGAFGFYTA